jgi:hypothetical protein
MSANGSPLLKRDPPKSHVSKEDDEESDVSDEEDTEILLGEEDLDEFGDVSHNSDENAPLMENSDEEYTDDDDNVNIADNDVIWNENTWDQRLSVCSFKDLGYMVPPRFPERRVSYDETPLNENSEVSTYYVVRIFDYDWMNRGFSELCFLLAHNDTALLIVNTIFVHHTVRGGCGYGRALGRALLRNKVVTRLELDPYTFFRYPDNANQDDANSMIQFIRTSQTLRTVDLDHNHGRFPVSSQQAGHPSILNLLGRILDAVIENPHITSFFADVRLPLRKFVHLLATKQAISKIYLGPNTLKGVARVKDHTDCFADALAGFASLKSLSLSFCSETSPVVEQVLFLLRSHPSLDYLCIKDMIIPLHAAFNMKALEGFLRSSKVLRMLRIAMDCDRESVEYLLDGLQANRSVNVLALDLSDYTPEAALRVAQFIKTKANRDGNVLRDVRLTVREGIDDAEELLPLVEFMVIGSQLECFELDGELHPLSGFVKQLEHHAATMRLQRIWLENGNLRRSEMRALARYLTRTATLQNLRVSHIHGYSSSGLLEAIRQNGSLQSVALVHGDKDTSVFDASKTAKVQAYMERNINLPKLLALPVSEGDNEIMANFHRFPALFSVAKQAPRTATNFLFLGLLSIPSKQSDRLRTRS